MLPTRRRLASASLAFLAVSLASPGALGALSASPGVLAFAVRAGAEGEARVTLTNSLDGPVEVRVSLGDGRTDGEGVSEIPEPGRPERSCAAWISLDETFLRLAAGESRELRLVMRVPQGARGGFWTELRFEESAPSPSAPAASSTGPSSSSAAAPPTDPAPAPAPAASSTVASSSPSAPGASALLRRVVSVPVLQEVPGTAFRDAEITGVSAVFAREDLPNVRVRMANSGNTILRCAGRIELRGEDGAVRAKLPLGTGGRFLLFPARDLEVAASPATPLPPGTYTAVAILDFGGRHLVASEAVFEVPGSTPLGGE
jgi:hypothetical protein